MTVTQVTVTGVGDKSDRDINNDCDTGDSDRSW